MHQDRAGQSSFALASTVGSEHPLEVKRTPAASFDTSIKAVTAANGVSVERIHVGVHLLDVPHAGPAHAQ